MRTRAPLFLVLIAALALPAAGAAARHRATCQRDRSVTAAQNRFARLFETDPRTNGTTHLLFGCLKSTGKTVRLERAHDNSFGGSGYDHVTLVRRTVAWVFVRTRICFDDCPSDFNANTYAIKIRNLRRAKTKKVPAPERPNALKLSSFGAVAWLDGGGSDTNLFAYDSRGRRHVAHGSIPGASLKISGHTLSWTQGGTRHTAHLSG